MGIRGPIVTSEGNYILANAATNELRIYNAAGVLIKVSGRQGNGPGEFPTGPFGIFRCAADTIVVKENRRVSIWRADGEYAGITSTQTGSSDRLRNVVGVSPDCESMLVETGDPRLPNDQVVRVENRLFWYKRNGDSRDTVARFRGIEAVRVEYFGREFRSRVPWAPAPVYALRDSFLLFGDAEQPLFRVIDPAGRVAAIISWNSKSRDVDPEDRDKFESRRQAYLATHPDQAKNYPPVDMLSPRKTKPFYSAALTDSEGNLWVREYPDADAGSPGFFAPHPASLMISWNVFDVGGRWLGAVKIPAPLSVRQITPSKVIGVWRDHDDVESVRVYEISKPKH